MKLNLSERAFKRQFIIRAKTTAFTTIGQEDIAECSGLFQEKKEQEKIGTYFRLFLLSRKASNATIKLPKDISNANIPMKIEMIS